MVRASDFTITFPTTGTWKAVKELQGSLKMNARVIRDGVVSEVVITNFFLFLFVQS